MTSLTVGTNDEADNTGDLIVTFVDSSPPGVTTDGTRTALPGAAWGCYLVAPSISPQPGCVLTLSPTTAQWESLSLIWQPPPHAAIIWTSGGSFAGSGGSVANPKFPPQSLTGAGETDAAASISARARIQAAVSASVGASAGISARALVRSALGATAAGAGRASSDFVIQHPGGTLWFSGGLAAASGGLSGRANYRAAVAGNVGAAAGISGDASRAGVGQQYTIAGEIDGAGGISSNPWIGHRYFVAAQTAAGGGVIPFGGNAPLRLTNYVRNPRPEGVVIGNVDGVNNTGPTSWWLLYGNPDSIVAVNIVGVGTESGIPFVDIQYTSGGAPAGFITLQTDGGIAASAGQVWSYAAFVRLSAGSLASVSSIGLQFLTDGTTGGTYNGPTFTPTGAGLATQWHNYNGQLINDTGMTNISAGLVTNFSGGAVNMTLRIGGPKAEKATTASGSQYLLVPQVGFAPTGFGSSTSYVF